MRSLFTHNSTTFLSLFYHHVVYTNPSIEKGTILDVTTFCLSAFSLPRCTFLGSYNDQEHILITMTYFQQLTMLFAFYTNQEHIPMPLAYFQQLFHTSLESYTDQACHPFNIVFPYFLVPMLNDISKECTNYAS